MKINYITKIFLLIFSTICTLTIIIFLLLYYQFNNFTIEHEIKSIQNSSNLYVEEIKDVFLTLDDIGQKLSTDETVHNILQNDITDPIQAVKNRSQFISFFDNWYIDSHDYIEQMISISFIVNHDLPIANELVPFANKELNNYTFALYSDKHLNSYDWYNKIISSNLSSIQKVDVEYDKYYAHFAYPIYKFSTYQKDFLGILMFSINFQQLLNNSKNITSSANMQYAIGNDDGTFLAYSSNWKKENTDNLLLINNNYPYDTSKKYVSVDSIGYNLSIISKIAYDDIIFPINHINKQYIFILILTLIITFIISIFLAHSFSKPIKKLSSKMTNFEQSSTFLEDDFNTYPKDIIMLFRAYNKMTNNISELINNIKKQSEKELEIEAKLLQAQMSPHFLYNALDSIACSMLLEGENKVADSITLLSEICRYSLHNSNVSATIREELKFITLYVEFQSWQFEKEIRLETNVDNEILNYKIPKHTIQPIVENSIIHNRNQDNLIVKLSFHENDDYIIIEIADNGTGCNVNNLNDYLNGNENIFTSPKNGIKNVHSRLRLKFGHDSGLCFFENPEGGLKAVITIRKNHM